MGFTIYLKDEVANEINSHMPVGKIITVTTLDYQNGCIWKNKYGLPVANILFIKEG